MMRLRTIQHDAIRARSEQNPKTLKLNWKIVVGISVSLTFLFNQHNSLEWYKIVAKQHALREGTDTTDDTSLLSTEIMTKIQALTHELENSKIRYYVYDDGGLRLPKIRAQANRFDKPWAWKARWGKRFEEYARGEIRWLESLETSTLRTRDPLEADFFVVPIPITATHFWGTTSDRTTALRRLLFGWNHSDSNINSSNNSSNIDESSLFRRFPEKHLAAISTSEKLINWLGLPEAELRLFRNSTLVSDADLARSDDWLRDQNIIHCDKVEKHGHFESRWFRNVVTLGYSFEAGNPSFFYQPVTMDAWAQKSNWFFYHSRKTQFTCNSTIFRHALLPGGHAETLMAQNMGSNNTNNNTNFTHVIQGFRHQPVSIGFDIPYEEWQQKFINSKFCLVIRGDTPGSRSLFRAIRAGCMPVIVSDQLPYYQPIYINTFPNWNDFALVVPEDIFLADPVGSLDAAVDALMQSKLVLERKIEGLRLLQRIMTNDMSDSLFVPALAKEILIATRSK